MTVGWHASSLSRSWNFEDDAYADIDRSEIRTFDLMDDDDVICAVGIPLGKGSHLVYRRRSSMEVGFVRRVQHLFGFVDGAVWCYDETTRELYLGQFGDEHDVADFGWPISHTFEGEVSF
jgi:hypothetical protein